MKRKIIVPVSYMGSGSSAVTDLISEFENVNNKCGVFEYVFLLEKFPLELHNY